MTEPHSIMEVIPMIERFGEREDHVLPLTQALGMVPTHTC